MNPLEQHSGEQKIRLDDDAAESRALANGQGIGEERCRDAGESRSGPTGWISLLEEACHLGDVGIRIRVAAAAADQQEKGFGRCDFGSACQSLLVADASQ